MSELPKYRRETAKRSHNSIESECYFTSDLLAQKCINHLNSLRPLNHFDFIIEPSAGAGAFYKYLPAKSIAIDIEPRNLGILRANFLQYKCGFTGIGLIIGNPPFGVRGKIALEFLNKAMSIANIIAFILPRSFKKPDYFKKINKFFHLVDSFDCNDFIDLNGNKKSINCVFQIWEKREYERIDVIRDMEHKDLELRNISVSRISVEKLEKYKNYYDFAIKQVGEDLSVRLPSEIKSSSWWLIKVVNKEKFQKIDLSFVKNSNSIIQSISKKDIIEAYKKL